jgi:acetate kinase
MSSGACILTINGGSSSIKFALHRMDGNQSRKDLRGKIDRIGLQGTHFTFDDPTR